MTENASKDIGIFYGSSTGNTENVAVIIKDQLTEYNVDIHDTAHVSTDMVQPYKVLIFGVPTWGSSGIQEDLDEFLQPLKKKDLSGKKVALFGLGDQATYGDSFADALGILYHELAPLGCVFIGKWPDEGYDYKQSKAFKDGSFVGLVIDEDIQPEKTKERVQKWTEQLKKEID